MSEELEPAQGKRRKRRLIPIPVRILAVFALLFFIVSTITGVPVFEEFRERARRVVERNLPVETTAAVARRKLDGRLTAANLSLGSETFVRIFKQEAVLEVWMKGAEGFRRLHTYPICKHSGFLGPKLKEGDKQAPEGFYAVTAKQLNPGSRHYRAFNLGFPNEYDRAHGRTGSALMVHGGCSSVGCYAMTDLGVAEIYRVVEKALARGQKKADGSRTRDDDATFTKKHGQKYHGYKLHAATDRQGLITDLRVTTAKVHDSRLIDELTERETRLVAADSAYASKERRAALWARGVVPAIIYKRSRGQAELYDSQIKLNKLFASIRAAVEHPFAMIKRDMGLRRCRYRGLDRNEQHFTLAAIAANIKRSCHLRERASPT